MKNPLQFYQTQLLFSNALEDRAVFLSDDIRISILDDDYRQEINKEYKKIIDNIESTIWQNGDNLPQYLEMVIHVSLKLIEDAEDIIQNMLKSLIDNVNTEKLLMAYNNIQTLYENLIKTHNHIARYYFTKKELKPLDVKYPVITKEQTERIINDCEPNIGKKDTELNISGIIVKIKTSEIHELETVIERKPLDIEHEAKIEQRSESATKTSELQVCDEKIEFKGTVETLALLLRLMINNGLIEAHKSKTKIVRILTKIIDTKGQEDLSFNYLYNLLTTSNHVFEPKYVENLHSALAKMTSEITKYK